MFPLFHPHSPKYIFSFGDIVSVYPHTFPQMARVPTLPLQRLVLTVLIASHGQPQDKVDNDGSEQGNGEDGGTQPVVEATLAPQPYAPGAPVEGEEGVNHGHHGDHGEEAGRDLSDLVAKVKEADCETAEDDGEVEP